MSKPSPRALRFAHDVYVKMHGEHVFSTDEMEHVEILARVFDATEQAAREQYERGIIAEREACAAICDEDGAFNDGDSALSAAEKIRARGAS